MLLQQLRIDALHNALVETDIAALRIHLILLARWGCPGIGGSHLAGSGEGENALRFYCSSFNRY